MCNTGSMDPDDVLLSEPQKIDYIYRYVAELKAKSDQENSDQDIQNTDQLWAVNGLQRHSSGTSGRVVLAGVAITGNSNTHLWQQEAEVTELLALDWATHAQTLEALGHPVRLSILQAILGGVHTVQEFTELPSMGTTGQVYHHLRDLIAADWVRAVRRNHYDIPASRVIPLLTVLLGTLPRSVE